MADIELVIKIDEELYNYMQTDKYDKHLDKRFDYQIRFAVKDGTPLPKGHGDLIDVSRKITVPVYDEEFEEYEDKVMTVLEALNRWSDEGITVKDIIILADKEQTDGNVD